MDQFSKTKVMRKAIPVISNLRNPQSMIKRREKVYQKIIKELEAISLVEENPDPCRNLCLYAKSSQKEPL
jgi:hypothetical protein